MTSPLSQYKNPKLWKLDESRLPVKSYVSVPIEPRPATPGAMRWRLRRGWPQEDTILYESLAYEEYQIRERKYGTRRSCSVWRQGVEISGPYGLLRDAKAYAAQNASGKIRVNVA